MDPIIGFVMIIAALMLLGVLGEFVLKKTGIPDGCILVLAGIIAGPVLGLIPPETLQPVVPWFGAIALVVILTGGGFGLNITEVARVAPRGVSVALVGFAFSVAGVCGFCYAMNALGLIQSSNPIIWIMIGAMLGGSSSVVIFPVMAGGNIDRKAAGLLEVESSMTDALCIVVTMVLLDAIAVTGGDATHPAAMLGNQLAIGLVTGAVAGLAMIPLMPGLRGKAHGYTVILAVMFLVYGLSSHWGGNGALAVLVGSMIMGNAGLIMKRSVPGMPMNAYKRDITVQSINGFMSFMIKAFFFTLVGVMFPLEPRIILVGALCAAVLQLVRIPAVLLVMLGAGLKLKQLQLIIYAIPRGIAAGVLASLPASRNIPGMENLAPGIYATIVFSILFFGMSYGFLRHDQDKDKQADEAV
jgi:cell volume regulation protein A